jgi:hypothetical protein
MSADLRRLLTRAEAATGRDTRLDAAIGEALEGVDARQPSPDYTASVDSCIALFRRVLPGWHWHIGHGPRGILPYAAVSKDADEIAPTVPLALLRALLKAKIADSDPAAAGSRRARSTRRWTR